MTFNTNYKVMAFSKANQYEPDQQLLNYYCKVISHPARQKIIEQLRLAGPCTVMELLRGHPISGTAFSGHLKILWEAKVILYKEEYPYIYYYLNLEKLEELKKMTERFFERLGI